MIHRSIPRRQWSASLVISLFILAVCSGSAAAQTQPADEAAAQPAPAEPTAAAQPEPAAEPAPEPAAAG